MKEHEIPPFFIGQEVVAIKDHSKGSFKKGDEFKITGLFKCCCGWNVTIGIRDNSGYPQEAICGSCGRGEIIGVRVEWRYNSKIFAPKHNYGAFISMSEAVQLETIGAN